VCAPVCWVCLVGYVYVRKELRAGVRPPAVLCACVGVLLGSSLLKWPFADSFDFVKRTLHLRARLTLSSSPYICVLVLGVQNHHCCRQRLLLLLVLL
jgi:hypothetical protein